MTAATAAHGLVFALMRALAAEVVFKPVFAQETLGSSNAPTSGFLFVEYFCFSHLF